MSQTASSSNEPMEQVRRPMGPDFVRLFYQQLEEEYDGDEQRSTGLALALIRDAWRERATDIHIDPYTTGGMIRFRVDGNLLDAIYLSPDQTRKITNQVKVLAQVDPVRSFVPHDARWTQQMDDEHEFDIRLTTAPCITGEKIAMRLLDPLQAEQRISELGFCGMDERAIKEWLRSVNGMVLTTGPTGAGKTTTLYALLHELKGRQRSIVTIENPIEYHVDGIVQMQVDERHDFTFPRAIKTMLRMDPDYMMVGEVRDPQSARAAADAAMSGHVLMSTLHSRDAVGAVTALRNWGLKNLEIAVCLSVVVAQRLVRRLCNNCKATRKPTDEEARWLDAMTLPVPDEVHQGEGCDQCRRLGYRGRIGVYELWRIDQEDYDLILHGADEKTLYKALQVKAHATLLHDALEKVVDGITSVAEMQSMGELVPPIQTGLKVAGGR